jgi:hypothetical protein
MESSLLNLCTVTLGTDAQIVNENLIKFNEIYKNVKLYIICPRKDEEIFIKTIVNKNYEIITEEELISLSEFKQIFEKISDNLNYKDEFKERLSWYYALVLKFCFVHRFFQKNNDHLVIWEGDTIILKKIQFFKNFESQLYAYVSYFHKIHFDTCEKLLGKLPRYYGSFITQFGSITKEESNFLFKSLELENLSNKEFNFLFSEKVLRAIFDKHSKYDNAMFADYELIGINNLNKRYKKQIPIFFLRPALDGKLTKKQKIIAKIFDVKHITYEHRHPNKRSQDMLTRNQTWVRFFKILIFFYFQFKFHQFKFNLKYLFN